MATNTTTDFAKGDEGLAQEVPIQSVLSVDAKPEEDQIERIKTNNDLNLHYDEVDKEPELHAGTWVALASMLALNYILVIALQGSPAVVSLKRVHSSICVKSDD